MSEDISRKEVNLGCRHCCFALVVVVRLGIIRTHCSSECSKCSTINPVGGEVADVEMR